MFNDSFTAQVKNVNLRRVDDSEGDGEIWLDLTLEMELDKEQVQDLGAAARAIVGSAENNSPQVFPVRMAKLFEEFSGQTFQVLDASGLRFEIGDCTARKLEIHRDEEDATAVRLKWQVQTTPADRKQRDYLVTLIGEEGQFALITAQAELEV